MTPEGVLTRIVPAVETLLKAAVEQACAAAAPPSLYELEVLTQRVLPQIGQVISQGQVLYRVDDSPVVLLYGSTPAYRSLSAGATDRKSVV